jgi:hypothetical protein
LPPIIWWKSGSELGSQSSINPGNAIAIQLWEKGTKRADFCLNISVVPAGTHPHVVPN